MKLFKNMRTFNEDIRGRSWAIMAYFTVCAALLFIAAVRSVTTAPTTVPQNCLELLFLQASDESPETWRYNPCKPQDDWDVSLYTVGVIFIALLAVVIGAYLLALLLVSKSPNEHRLQMSARFTGTLGVSLFAVGTVSLGTFNAFGGTAALLMTVSAALLGAASVTLTSCSKTLARLKEERDLPGGDGERVVDGLTDGDARETKDADEVLRRLESIEDQLARILADSMRTPPRLSVPGLLQRLFRAS